MRMLALVFVLLCGHHVIMFGWLKAVFKEVVVEEVEVADDTRQKWVLTRSPRGTWSVVNVWVNGMACMSSWGEGARRAEWL